MLGMHGTYAANMAITESDLIIAMGARFDDRATGKTDEFAPHAKIIHVDIDPTSISKNIKVDIPIVGDTKNVIAKMIEIAEEDKETFIQQHKRVAEWVDKINTWKKDYPLTYQKDSTLKPQYVIERICELTKGQGYHHHGSRTESDVDSPVLQIPEAEDDAHLRWSGHHGLWLSGSDRGPGGLSEIPCHRHRR